MEIVNKKTGKIVYTINYQNGLPDDEIYSLGLDNNNGLWLAHEFGISRVDFNLPIREYSHYPGLEGNLIASLWHNNQLYVATNEGVYCLDKVKNYTEVEVLVKIKPKPIKKSTPTQIKPETETEQEEKKPIRKLFSKLFGPKKQEDSSPKETDTSKKEKTRAAPVKSRYVKKTVSELKSTHHVFKKISGIEEKCKQLVSTEQGILAAANTGLYYIKNQQAHKIIHDRNIQHISKQTARENYLLATNTGILKLSFIDNEWVSSSLAVDFQEPVYTIHKTGNTVWCGGINKAFQIKTDSLEQPVSFKSYKAQTDFPEAYYLDRTNDTIFLFLESGIFFYHEKTDSFTTYPLKNVTLSNPKFILVEQGNPWIYHPHRWQCLNRNNPWPDFEQSLLKLFEDINAIHTDPQNNLWVINNNSEIYKIMHNAGYYSKSSFNVYLKSITNDKGLHFAFSDLVFEPDNNAIYVDITAPSYLKKQSTQYQYFIEGLMNSWSKWSTNQTINLIVKPRRYTLHVRAKDILGNKSQIKSIQFTIKPPFTETIGFYILVGIVILIGFYLMHKLREKKLIHDKKVLEQKVRQRTLEIQEQKEEIEAQRDELEAQRDKILSQKDDITDSITYASRIQKAMLPMNEHFDKSFKDHFILYKPRNIVSGDFYWIAEDTEKIYFAAADCTGHGVPGAFMSMLGISSLNEIISGDKQKLTAAKILNMLREKVKFSLHQTGKEGEAKDGMDIALCILDKKTMLLEYAGAYNPLYHFRNGKLNEYKADRMPIGIYYMEKETFTNHELTIIPGDTIYLFSDGYADQFGGPAQTKFKSTNLKKLFTEIVNQPMNKQKGILEEKFNQWKGDLDQVDDIIVLGIKF
ncbi:MAG: SpoIIE family protein phosphatase [Bacteroidales bacterium]